MRQTDYSQYLPEFSLTPKTCAFRPTVFHSNPHICQIGFLISFHTGSYDPHLENPRENTDFRNFFFFFNSHNNVPYQQRQCSFNNISTTKPNNEQILVVLWCTIGQMPNEPDVHATMSCPWPEINRWLSDLRTSNKMSPKMRISYLMKLSRHDENATTSCNCQDFLPSTLGRSLSLPEMFCDYHALNIVHNVCSKLLAFLWKLQVDFKSWDGFSVRF